MKVICSLGKILYLYLYYNKIFLSYQIQFRLQTIETNVLLPNFTVLNHPFNGF